MADVPDRDGGDFVLSREALLDGTFDAYITRAARQGLIKPRPAEERDAIKEAVLADHPPGQDIWVFGYGSLIWNPAFHFVERCPALIRGYHRAFSFWITSGRGTQALPGLMLGLDRGGSCNGVAFRIAAESADQEMHCIFLREMMGEAYEPRWVMAAADRGGAARETVRALTFVVNRGFPRYAGRLPLETQARHLAEAEGQVGTCRDYLFNTVTHLAALGIVDHTLARLTRLVAAHRERQAAE